MVQEPGSSSISRTSHHGEPKTPDGPAATGTHCESTWISEYRASTLGSETVSVASERLTGTALVTGGGRGIGARIARELADAGRGVAVTRRTAAEGPALPARMYRPRTPRARPQPARPPPPGH